MNTYNDIRRFCATRNRGVYLTNSACKILHEIIQFIFDDFIDSAAAMVCYAKKKTITGESIILWADYKLSYGLSLNICRHYKNVLNGRDKFSF